MLNANFAEKHVPPFVTFNEACEIMPKERVISIHDTVHFLGLEPQAIESAIDLSISADELACMVASSTRVLYPVVATPQHLVSRDPTKLIYAGTRAGATRPLVPSLLGRTKRGYRLLQIGPDPATIGKDAFDQKAMLARVVGQTIASTHALMLAALLFHELRAIDVLGSEWVRTGDMAGSGACHGLLMNGGRVYLDYVSKFAQSRVGAIGEIVL